MYMRFFFSSDYCPSGYEVETEGICRICPREMYKDNTVDIQGMCTPCPNNLRADTDGATAEANCTICMFSFDFSFDLL